MSYLREEMSGGNILGSTRGNYPGGGKCPTIGLKRELKLLPFGHVLILRRYEIF